ncbi:MAG: M20/M25/M40 family metallo-hydrolase [Candidatus Cryptobacteroides sp.]
MNRLRTSVFAVLAILAACTAFGLFTRPAVQDSDSEGFSAQRVLQDIEVISKEHHSVAHPVERAAVRDYLVGRLDELGADTVRLFVYDSLTGPKFKHVSYTFTATDILAEFSPLGSRPETAGETPDSCACAGEDVCLMLVAHYDSRYSQIMPKDTVWSYGAADDGYGVGVILETVGRLLEERGQWKRGVKVLFTDAEEVGMMGMSSIYEHNREVFENVGLMINVEARGTYGPVLLFETSPGNSRLMELYSDAARFPYTYSLTTVVYGFMPNFTDFTIVKDDIPGLNFSTVADVNHYHTDLDNFSNVSARTVQHYGSQVLPVASKYLTDEAYSGKDSLRSESDTVNFTIPVIGLLNMGKRAYLIINIVVFVLFLLLLLLDCVRGRVKIGGVLGKAGKYLVTALLVLAAGIGVTWLCSKIAGAAFKPFGVIAGIPFDNAVTAVLIALLLLACTAVYVRSRGRAALRASSSMRRKAASEAESRYSYSVLYAVLAIDLLLSALLLLLVGENLMFFVPLVLAVSALLLERLTRLRFWYLLAALVLLLHACSFLFALSMALTIGAFGLVAMIAYLDIMVLVPLADRFITE